MKEYCKICLLMLGALTIWGPKAMAQNVKAQNNENSTVVTEQAGTNEKVGENLNDKVLNEKPVNEAVGALLLLLIALWSHLFSGLLVASIPTR